MDFNIYLFKGPGFCFLALEDVVLVYMTTMPQHRRSNRRGPPGPQPGHTELPSAVPSCPCGKPDSHQALIGCDGPCSGWFDYDCAGVSDVPTGEWICLSCSIKNTRSVRVLRHIPKGARIQTAQALTTIINDCISGDAGVLPWWKLLFFGCTALAIPDTSSNDSSGPSLTTIVKHQVAAVAFSSTDFFPLLYNQRSPTRPDPSSSNDSTRVEAKLSDGDVSGAVHLASSNDTLASFDDETLSGLQSKHPSSPPDLEFPEPPDDSSEVLSVLCAVVTRAIQGCPEKLRGPGQRVKVGPQRQGGFHSESQLHSSCKLKTKKKKKSQPIATDNDNNYPSPTVSPYL